MRKWDEEDQLSTIEISLINQLMGTHKLYNVHKVVCLLQNPISIYY